MNPRSLLLACAGLVWAAGGAAADTLHYWTQLGAGGELIARAVVRPPDCPVLRVGGQAVPMVRRAAPTAAFPGLVCELQLPRGASEVFLGGRPLPTLKPEVRRIAVIGDTGCRIKGSRAQACADAHAWPLRTIVAVLVARQPDLVIHVGDYLYRQSVCPPSADCQGSPYGYDWPAWAADWFDPAQPLLAQAPFVFVRGNHEECGRAAVGWFRHLAAGPVPAACPTASEPWQAAVAGVDLIVFDAADGPAPFSSPDQLPVYRRMADAMFATVGRDAWFLTHRPLWAHVAASGEVITGDRTQREAFGARFPPSVGLILSGHIHAFQALDLVGRPAQVISGNGGTELDPLPDEVRHDVEIAGTLARTITSDAGFGFLVLDRIDGSDWRIQVLDVHGALRRRCRLAGRALSCGGAKP